MVMFPLSADCAPPCSQAQPSLDGGRSDPSGGQRQRDKQLGEVVPAPQR